MQNKEYKVITSNTPAFGNPQKLQQILAEEAQNGWDLEELLDPNKIRVSRDRSARANDANAKIDPYRINVGLNNALYMSLVAVVTVLVIMATIYVASMSV